MLRTYSLNLDETQLKLLRDVITTQMDELENMNCDRDQKVEDLEGILNKVKGGILTCEVKW